MNLQEDFCSQELYKLLIDKGFEVSSYDAPFTYRLVTHQSAMKWLREKGYHIVVFTDSPRYAVDIQDLNNGSFNVSGITRTYDTYEEAVEDAIKYSLENLI